MRKKLSPIYIISYNCESAGNAAQSAFPKAHSKKNNRYPKISS